MVAVCINREFGEKPKQLTSTVKSYETFECNPHFNHWETGKMNGVGLKL
jgi:hypothetical protein